MLGPNAMKPLWIGLCLATVLVAEAGRAAESAPPPDLPGLLACKKSMKDWGQLGAAYREPANLARWGWQETKVGSGFLQVFELRKPIGVFGEKASKIAFSGTSVVALLKRRTLEQLVDELHLTPAGNGPTTRIFGKVVSSTTEKSGDTTITTQISLTVSTSPQYPGVVLAGCSYSVEVQ
jgi:hypothetical protein